MNSKAVVIVFVIFLLSCAGPAPKKAEEDAGTEPAAVAAPEQPELGSDFDPEEYAVYAVVLDAIETVSVNTILLSRTTIHRAWRGNKEVSYDLASEKGDAAPSKKLYRGIPGLLPETIEDYEGRNDKSCVLEDRFDTRVRIALLDEKAFHELKWKEILEKYPLAGGNRYRLSRAGFNEEKTQALVYLDRYRNAMDAQGCHYFLVNEGGQWRIKAKTVGWKS